MIFRYFKSSIFIVCLSCSFGIALYAYPSGDELDVRPSKQTTAKKDKTDRVEAGKSKLDKGSAAQADKAEDEIDSAWMKTIRGSKDAADAANTSEKDEKASRLRDTAAENDNGVFPREEGPSFLSVIIRFLGLAAVLIGILYFLMRSMRSSRGGSIVGTDLVRVIASVPLLQGKFLQIVDVAGRLMLLGVSESGVRLVLEVTDPLMADRIRMFESKQIASSPVGFLQTVQESIRGADFGIFPKKKQEKNAIDFAELLSKQTVPLKETVQRTPVADVAADIPGKGKDARRQSDDFFEFLREETSSTPPDEIKELLKIQKSKLSALRKQSDV